MSGSSSAAARRAPAAVISNRQSWPIRVSSMDAVSAVSG